VLLEFNEANPAWRRLDGFTNTSSANRYSRCPHAGHLQQLGIVREMTGKQRHRLYIYDRYMAILNQDEKISEKPR
jgi:hypothetical protein